MMFTQKPAAHKESFVVKRIHRSGRITGLEQIGKPLQTPSHFGMLFTQQAPASQAARGNQDPQP